MKHYKLVEILSNLNVMPPSTDVKPPYWQLTGDGSGSTAHAVSCEKRVYDIHYSVFLLGKNISTGSWVTRQETTFNRTISRNQRLQTKTLEK